MSTSPRSSGADGSCLGFNISLTGMMLIPPRDAEGPEQIVQSKEDEQVYHFPRVVVKRATSGQTTPSKAGNFDSPCAVPSTGKSSNW